MELVSVTYSSDSAKQKLEQYSTAMKPEHRFLLHYTFCKSMNTFSPDVGNNTESNVGVKTKI